MLQRILPCINMCLVASVLTVLPAKAEQLDLSTVKCKEFFEAGKENISFILMWLEGYYSEDEKPIVDFDKMKENGTKLGEYCAKNPDHGLLTAAEEVFKD